MRLNKEYNFNLSAFLWALNKSHRLYLEKNILDLNVTLNQYPYLLFLNFFTGCRQEDIAHVFKVDKCSVSRTLRILEDNGFVSREIDPNNRRSYILGLTDEGKEVFAKLDEIDKKWEDNVYESLGLDREDSENLFAKIFGNSKNFVEFLLSSEEDI